LPQKLLGLETCSVPGVSTAVILVAGGCSHSGVSTPFWCPGRVHCCRFFSNSGILTRAVWWRLALALLYQSLAWYWCWCLLYQSLPLLRGKLWLCLSLLRTKVWLKSRGWSSALLGPLGDGFDSTKNVASSASWSDSDTGWPSGVTAMSSGIEKSSTLTLRWFCARYMR